MGIMVVRLPVRSSLADYWDMLSTSVDIENTAPFIGPFM
jgi:hypothetical protein